MIEFIKICIKQTSNLNIPILCRETPATKNTIINTIEEFAEFYKLIPEKYKKRKKYCISR